MKASTRPLSGGRIFMALFPYLLIIVVFCIAKLVPPVINFLAATDVKIEWPGHYGNVMNLAGEPSGSAIYSFTWLSNPGTILLICTIITAMVYKVKPGEVVKTYTFNLHKMRFSILTVASVLTLAYIMNLSGQTISIGYWIAGTGGLFAFLSPILGWIGTAVTGSDTSANALFATLQQTAAQNAGIDPTLLVAANTSGGVVGKMIRPQNLTIAPTAVGLWGRESEILRRVMIWSIGLLLVLCVLVGLQSTPIPVLDAAVTAPGAGLRVALFATCINDVMFPGTPRAVVKLLERLGCTVEFPKDQTCCGQMHINTGYMAEAEPIVRNYAKVFEGYDYVVAPSGSCTGSVREQHAQVARHVGDAGLERAADESARRTFELTEFLVDVLKVTNVGAYFPHKVTYHPTCHSMRVTKVGDRPYQLLKEVKGITLLDLPDADRCCGFGGTFSLKNPDISVAMTNDKARHVASTGAEYLVAGDNSCLLSIGGALSRQKAGVKPIHLAEILASTEEDTR